MSLSALPPALKDRVTGAETETNEGSAAVIAGAGDDGGSGDELIDVGKVDSVESTLFLLGRPLFDTGFFFSAKRVLLLFLRNCSTNAS